MNGVSATGRSDAATADQARGTVDELISPLSPVGAQPVLSWGQPGPGASPLARALLADLLGTDARCPQCRTAGDHGCADCVGSGLSAWPRNLADAFGGEVVSSFPGTGFELSASAVVRWMSQAPAALSSASAQLDDGAGTASWVAWKMRW